MILEYFGTSLAKFFKFTGQYRVDKKLPHDLGSTLKKLQPVYILLSYRENCCIEYYIGRISF